MMQKVRRKISVS